jgi:predicted ribosome quality control (RQC) complex YloA/Tae2 family protein
VKAFVLQKISSLILQGSTIKRALRVDENVILLQIDKSKYFFDLNKGNSDIYIDIEYDIAKKFNAPFDVVLAKRFTKSKILEVKAVERILTIKVQTNLNFKTQINYIQFEFTGRWTNCIILDENFVVVDALHHISSNVSFREVKPNEVLKPLPPKKIQEKVFEIDDVIEYTQKLFYQKFEKRLNQIKLSQINLANKKIEKLSKILNSLQSQDDLMKQSRLYEKYANLAMINLYKIKNKYEKFIEVKDFDGTIIKIPIPKLRNINEIGNYYYHQAKKMKNKAKNITIEKQNLEEKIEYLQNYKKGIQKATSISELNIYKSSKKSKSKEDNVEQFFIDDFVVKVGKNEKGNIKLLKTSKANDIWLHIKDKKGAHVIIQTNKKNVPEDVIIKAGKLALVFSNANEGIVDYTQRRHLYIQEKAFVKYVTYKSIKLKI